MYFIPQFIKNMHKHQCNLAAPKCFYLFFFSLLGWGEWQFGSVPELSPRFILLQCHPQKVPYRPLWLRRKDPWEWRQSETWHKGQRTRSLICGRQDSGYIRKKFSENNKYLFFDPTERPTLESQKHPKEEWSAQRILSPPLLEIISPYLAHQVVEYIQGILGQLNCFRFCDGYWESVGVASGPQWGNPYICGESYRLRRGKENQGTRIEGSRAWTMRGN